MIWNVRTNAEWCLQYLQERATVAKAAILSATEDDSCYVRTIITDPFDSDADGSDTSHADSFVTTESYSLDQERDTLSFGCAYLHTPGRPVLSATPLRFELSVSKVLPYTDFGKPYPELIEMTKQQTHASVLKPLAKVTAELDKLELVFRGAGGGAGMHDMRDTSNAETVVLENMRGRDKTFNAIVGFSVCSGRVYSRNDGRRRNLRWMEM